MKIYAISGLGADERVFKYLKLKNELVPINWIEPIKNESITDYSRRLSTKINLPEKFCLLGVSFGGLIATEISKILNPELTILISSAEIKTELPFIYRLFGKTKIINIIPTKLFNPPRFLASYLFRTKEKELLNKILDDTDLKFTKWAVRQLINWKNNTRINNLLKIKFHL